MGLKITNIKMITKEEVVKNQLARYIPTSRFRDDQFTTIDPETGNEVSGDPIDRTDAVKHPRFEYWHGTPA
jgi:hypothetical protein